MRLADDRGSASVMAVSLVFVILLLSLGTAQVGSAVVARHRAQAAADLAALTGAIALPDGQSHACDQAREVAGRMGSRMTSCAVDELDVVVVVDSPVGLVLRDRTARATARAGPAIPY